jgi:hypothetical protein
VTTSEYEQARTAVSVACLRWLRSEVEPAEPPPRRERPADEPPFRLLELPVEPTPRDREHPLWDAWLDG